MKIFGWKPELPDQRDYKYKSQGIAKLPVSVDLRGLCPPIQDQGNLGSCTAHAILSAVSFLANKENKPLEIFSRLFLYYNERLLEGSVEIDSGAYIRDGIKSLNIKGCCIESLWPYNINKFRDKPTAGCYAEATNHQILLYRRIGNLIGMKSCLASGFPFIFGFCVYESFLRAKNGVIPMPRKNEILLGGHGVIAVGYDDATSRFLCRNSWGTSWGKKGYFTMPYAYVANNNLADDRWVITKSE